MPQTSSAKKKLRADAKKRVFNLRRLRQMRRAIKTAAGIKDIKALSVAFKAIDKAAKGGVIHKNKAAHLKSQLSKLAKG
jgi:small subunit ribosomal protein S20